MPPHVHDRWDTIVRNAYDSIYRPLRAQCNAAMSSHACLVAMYNASTDEGRTYPWWLRTLLRDAIDPANGLRGPWHTLASLSPTPVAACVIEKVGSSNWRKFFCHLNGGTDGKGGGCTEGCGGACLTKAYLSNFATPPRNARSAHEGYQEALLHQDAKWRTAVVLRDPLERFASGYLDKCRPFFAIHERHCMPRSVYINGTASKELYALTARMRFGAYADTFPLAWNVHFLPQALYCNDLGRNLEHYTFRGTLNTTFARQIRSFARDLDSAGAQRTATADSSSTVASFSASASASAAAAASFKERKDAYKSGHATIASDKVMNIMTRRVARRLLEYFSIDYVELGLPLPAFLEELQP